jgi:hypothetical protein
VPQLVRTSADVAADQIGVVCFERGRRHHVPREDDVPEPRREALDLPLDAVGHVRVAAVRHVAVDPAGVAAGGRARRVEQALLRDEDERRVADPAAGRISFRLRDLFIAAAEMHRAGAPASRGAPWDGLGERVVDLERPWTVAKWLSR